MDIFDIIIIALIVLLFIAFRGIILLILIAGVGFVILFPMVVFVVTQDVVRGIRNRF